jgi:hypothetical protein
MIDTISGAALTADQEFQAGFTCAGARATITQPLPSVCLASQFGSSLVSIPAPNTENDDHNPQRIGSRNLFDLSVGDDNLFHGDKRKWSAQLTVNKRDQQAGALQFSLHFQRHSLRDAANSHRSNWIPLLTG